METDKLIDITGKSYIAGKWVKPSGPSFQSFNPKTKEKIFSFHTCAIDEVSLAFEQADNAYQEYRKLDGATIGNFLNAIADEIEGLGDQLLEIGDSETALGVPRLTGERARTCGQIRAFAAIAAKGQWAQPSIDTAMPGRQPVPKPDLRRMMRPIGPVVVFGASNFPFAFGTLGGDTASALAAGNPVIVKGHPSHPATSELFALAVERACESCNIPKGVFSLLQGVGNSLGSELVKHPSAQAVGFTGSLAGGKALMDIAASRKVPIPVYAEMGSINPVFVLPNSLSNNKNSLASGISGSACLGTGQFCTSPGIIVTLKDDEFEALLAQAMDNVPRGILLNKKIAEGLSIGLQRLANYPKVEWLNSAEFDPSSLTPPNALFKTRAKTFLEDRSLSEEVFGPATILVTCDTWDEMVEIAKNLEGNLTATIHSQNDQLETILSEILEQKVGRVIYNGYPTGVEVCPSQQHGGPFPASSISTSTSVGADAIVRFARFVAYQNMPDALLPDALKNGNPLQLLRKVNGEFTNDTIN